MCGIIILLWYRRINMKRFEKDICYTHELLNGKKSNDYSSVFYSSNERFAEILSDFLIFL